MSFVRCAGKTGKLQIPAGAKKDAELIFLHEIVKNMEKFQILSSLMLTLDQTDSKYVSMGKTTMAEKGSNTVHIPSLSDKRFMTITFTITVNGKFLLMQLNFVLLASLQAC